MFSSYALGIAAVAVVAAAWVGVQLAWRRVFPDACADPDALAGRIGCHGCSDTETCEPRGELDPRDRGGRA